MQNIVTQVSEGGSRPLLQQQGSDLDSNQDAEDSLIHLNIQGSHYFLTRDQLMSLPESLLLCLFPSGVFLDINGQVITNLTPQDEVYIADFPSSCFEYILNIYSQAYEDLAKFPSHLFSPSLKDMYGNDKKNLLKYKQSSEEDLLHEKPVIIVLREDLDYYCVPQVEFEFQVDSKNAPQITESDLLHHIMSEVKIAAGDYLAYKTSIFDGLYSSNRLKNGDSNSIHSKTGSPNHNRSYNNNNSNNNNNHDGIRSLNYKLGAAEQHLMDMLCSSGFQKDSTWENRTQEHGKTVISSLSLCRINNETTEEFRGQYEQRREEWAISNKDKNNNTPQLYDLVPKPDINTKLLLFWRKPARKCWWGDEEIELDVEVYGKIVPSKEGSTVQTVRLFTPATDDGTELNKIRIPVRIHIRRVWTLELSLIGIQ
ncbi:hypothetical protein Kpol_526p45 [Vanderwaltozyma polyspora DSM 70294]|uniref:Uncharacterized protein n=1 Tax=Vanderwaltozyma polyspora (strain ATCC 22028 / DSM 70294 / BCRC 21397 / CBS 2163 / NBRC 10782 / NRRL Y-8283 / UCD 57-17) TaxID=436907 RepID=A7TLV0_VANPO|nr:uncharacterized protein Kpol_526p45 [Vanderwaltozyma polyspora DSM 70294]EDO16792.1 hypothetical protein Kpol_526p45 [Vanderwaltozyma polyspora DSM 70294]